MKLYCKIKALSYSVQVAVDKRNQCHVFKIVVGSLQAHDQDSFRIGEFSWN